MKTELLALIENYGKAPVHQTEGKISAFKDAKNLMSNIVFMLDKAEQEEAAIGAGGVERLRDVPTTPADPLLSNMDRGVLRMPMDLAMDGEISRRQFYQRVQSLLDRIDALPESTPKVPAIDVINKIIEGCCESDVAAPDHPDTISISVNDLRGVLECCIEQASTAATSEPVAWIRHPENPSIGDDLVWCEPDDRRTPLYTEPPAPTAPMAITSSLIRDDGGDKPAYCVMAAYREESDAVAALSLLGISLDVTRPPAALDAMRYRFIRDVPWNGTPLGRAIAQHRSAHWDASIDAAIAAQAQMNGEA